MIYCGFTQVSEKQAQKANQQKDNGTPNVITPLINHIFVCVKMVLLI